MLTHFEFWHIFDTFDTTSFDTTSFDIYLAHFYTLFTIVGTFWHIFNTFFTHFNTFWHIWHIFTTVWHILTHSLHILTHVDTFWHIWHIFTNVWHNLTHSDILKCYFVTQWEFNLETEQFNFAVDKQFKGKYCKHIFLYKFCYEIWSLVQEYTQALISSITKRRTKYILLGCKGDFFVFLRNIKVLHNVSMGAGEWKKNIFDIIQTMLGRFIQQVT